MVLFICLLLGNVRIGFLKRSQQFIFPFVGYNDKMIVGKRTSFQVASPGVGRGHQEQVFLQLGEKFRTIFLEWALISASKIDLKYCAIWETGPIPSKHICW